MGARPIYALAICGFPRDQLGAGVLERILQGGVDKAAEAGIAVVGGHSIDDTEPKYGLAVTGIVHPYRVIRNVGVKVGDRLILTKPLGMGIVATAVKRGVCSPAVLAQAVRVMATLNRDAAEAMLAVGGIHAATDVTGFGLLGHLSEMLGGSNAAARVTFGAIPFLEGVELLARADVIPGGTRRNHAGAAHTVRWGALDEQQQLMIADAQTSGGLLIALSPHDATALLAELNARGTPAAADIGEIVPGEGWIELV